MPNRETSARNILLFLGFFISVHVVMADENNLILNPSFENGAEVIGNNVRFENWEISTNPDNGKIRSWVETDIVRSGAKSVHWKTESSNSTNISYTYCSNYFRVNDSDYIEAGYWTYLISLSNSYGYEDMSIHFWDEDNKYLGKVHGEKEFGGGEVSFNKWNKISFIWYPAVLGSGRTYIPKGTKKARLEIYCDYHTPGIGERIDDDVFARGWDRMPTLLERMGIDTGNIHLTADYNKLQNRVDLSYSSDPDPGNEDFRTGGKGQAFWDIVKKFKFSKMKFPSGDFFTNLWYGEPICNFWDEKTNKYNWTLFDETIEAIKKVGAEPIISLPVGTWGNSNHLPEGMPLNKDVPVNEWSSLQGYFPNTNAYRQLVKDIVYHANIEKKYNIRYWEIGNQVVRIWLICWL